LRTQSHGGFGQFTALIFIYIYVRYGTVPVMYFVSLR
jgi:hypothetical protein